MNCCMQRRLTKLKCVFRCIASSPYLATCCQNLPQFASNAQLRGKDINVQGGGERHRSKFKSAPSQPTPADVSDFVVFSG